jgi:hypothetical protein
MHWIRKYYSYACHRLSQFVIEVSKFPRALSNQDSYQAGSFLATLLTRGPRWEFGIILDSDNPKYLIGIEES